MTANSVNPMEFISPASSGSKIPSSGGVAQRALSAVQPRVARATNPANHEGSLDMPVTLKIENKIHLKCTKCGWAINMDALKCDHISNGQYHILISVTPHKCSEKESEAEREKEIRKLWDEIAILKMST